MDNFVIMSLTWPLSHPSSAEVSLDEVTQVDTSLNFVWVVKRGFEITKYHWVIKIEEKE